MQISNENISNLTRWKRSITHRALGQLADAQKAHELIRAGASEAVVMRLLPGLFNRDELSAQIRIVHPGQPLIVLGAEL